MEVECSQCAMTFQKSKSDIRAKNNFCSRSCSAKYNNIGVNRHSHKRTRCPCGSIKRAQHKHCSKECRVEYELQDYIEKWKRGEISGTLSYGGIPSKVRKYLMLKYGGACQMCSWSEVHSVTGRVPLHIDHIDGKSQNNRPDNLRLLCPNCHALTETYGILNKGNSDRVHHYNK